ncbi:N-methyl-D-aspartate receptor NMDAR2C subunit [Pseudomonas sp. AA-38]|uniref:HD domain-containing protein n=1 Tax=Pseudomonas sp. AA-38 TaxID=3028807 RepID=UPI0023F80BE4|nr:N-methyl-D-aspartate receptor NMDAR2C subunit [Pseudomonas sp. AA-38]
MNLLTSSWAHAWSDLGLQPPPGLFEQLVRAYEEPQRHYHSLQHLSECLGHFEQARHLAQQPGEVAIALWFHDAIYDVRGKDNERRSADWAIETLAAAQADQATLARVEQLIMATRHDATPSAADEQLLVDIDLAILGAAPERFAEYDAQVRAEYAWVPGWVYRMKRRSVLKGFLARPRLYNTQHFRQRYEAQARINLAGAIG